MTMTPEASSYFQKIAPDWDSVRAGYFTEALRDLAIQKAYLHPDMVVADVGAGTGFMSAGLASSVKIVHLVDGSKEMLEIARKNLAQLTNVKFHEADGSHLPFDDQSLDAVFANMYLHHCPDPQQAISEITRVLRIGGRLILTDLEPHQHEWMKDQMADVWMGFDRQQIFDWYHSSGLVNIIVTRSGQSCCAEAKNEPAEPLENNLAKIGVFIATGTKNALGITGHVEKYYSNRAQTSTCCSSSNKVMDEKNASCCGTDSALVQESVKIINDYKQSELSSAPDAASSFSLGCGNPVAMSNLKPGETVLDIGSGGGLDCFLAAQRVGAAGKVIGVDMTDAMLSRARETASRNGYTQVEFRKGFADALPVTDNSVDVVLSNCVINLVPDKGSVFSEIHRVLQTGGRMEISDIVSDRSFTANAFKESDIWSACISGALPREEYLELIRQAGFCDIVIHSSKPAGEILGTRVFSITLSAKKSAASGCCCGSSCEDDQGGDGSSKNNSTCCS